MEVSAVRGESASHLVNGYQRQADAGVQPRDLVEPELEFLRRHKDQLALTPKGRGLLPRVKLSRAQERADL